MSLHSDTSSWYRDEQSLSLLWTLQRSSNYQCHGLSLEPTGAPNIYLTRDEHASYCTTDALTKVGDLLHLIILLFLSSFLHLTFAPCTSWFRTKPLLKIKHHLNLNKTQTKISKKKVWDNEDIYKMKHTLFDKCFISTCTCINKHG
jgi:hypothetical protein